MKIERITSESGYANVTYEQFTPKRFSAFLRRVAYICVLPFIYPLILGSKCSDYVFLTASELLSIVPFLFGISAREVFYRHTLKSCGRNVVIEFGVVFYYRNISVGDNVLISMQTTVHHCDIGSNVLIGGGCRLLSGSRQHNFERTDIPMTAQGGQVKKIKIGDDVWIGDNSVVMNDVREGCIIGAGSVVTKEVSPYSICTGNPAKVIGQRKKVVSG